MRNLVLIALGLMLWQNAAPAQTADLDTPQAETAGPGDGTNGVVGATGAGRSLEFTPLTRSERLRSYLKGTIGPGAIAKAAAAGGIAQWSGTPKEWGGGAEAFGERFGNAYAKHVIRETLEYGAAAVLREDNRYIRSTETGFWKRSKHAVGSTFVARNDAGSEHFAYSRFGAALGASFISRIWQPRSTNSAGDAAVSFGVEMASDIGGNVFQEFWPNIRSRFKRH